MKFVFFFAFIIFSVNVVAQQAPGAVKQEPDVVKQVPGTISIPAPPMAPTPAQQFSNNELSELLSAQTNAIRSLSHKLNLLEERINNIERTER